MKVETPDGSFELPDTPEGTGYPLVKDGKQIGWIGRFPLANNPPPPFDVTRKDTPPSAQAGAASPPPSASLGMGRDRDSFLSRGTDDKGPSAVRQGVEPIPAPPPTPALVVSVPLSTWAKLSGSMLAANVGALLVALIAYLFTLGGSAPTPTPRPGPSPNPSPIPSSQLGATLKTYLSTSPATWQTIGQDVRSGKLKTQADILSAFAVQSKPMFDGLKEAISTSSDSKGNVTDAATLGTTIESAGKEGGK